MRRFLRIICLLTCIGSGGVIIGQTNPAAQPIPYTQDFSTLTTTYPLGWQGWSVGTPGSNFSTSTTFADKLIVTGSASSTAGNIYNYSSQLGFLNNGTTDFTLVLAIDASSSDNLQMQYDLATIRNPYDGAANTRFNEVVLQYRIGTAGTFTTIPNTNYQNNTTTQTTSGVTTPQNKITYKIYLPSDCYNQPVVQLRWISRQVSGAGSRPSFVVDNVSINEDNTPPSFTNTFPQALNISSTSADLIVNTDEAAKVYYVVLSNDATAPTSAQIKAGQDDQGNPITNSGFITISSGNSNVSKTISSLSALTDYDFYVVAEDLLGNLQASPSKLDVATNATPTLSTSVSSITFSGFTDKSKQSSSLNYTIGAIYLTNDVTINASGNFLISTDNNTYSSSLTIASAVFSVDQTVYVKFNPSGNTGTQTGTITHSSTGASDKLIILSAVGIDPFNQNYNDPAFLTKSGWSQYSVTGAQVWASTNFGHTCLTGCTNATIDKAAQINGFASGAQNNEDWLISPQLDLTTFSNYPALSFATISAFEGDQLQLKYSSDYIGSGDPSLATWTSLDGKFPESNSGAWTASSSIILPKSSLYVAFVYTSNTTSASRWTLDDWKVEDVSNYLDVPSIKFAFGEVLQGNNSASQNFDFIANGYGDVTVSVPSGFEVSLDNTSFNSFVSVSEADALAGERIYVRLSPPSKQLKWTGAITFSGTGLNTSIGSLSGSSYLKSETFDVVTYNLEFFGTDVKDATNVEFGPTDDALQINNVTTVMQTIGADIYAVEEVADDNAFNQLVANLSGYDKILSNRWSHSDEPADPNFPPQKVGFIYKTSTVQFISSRVMFSEMYDAILAGTVTLPSYPTTSDSFWSSGRLPFMMTFDVTINGIKKRIRLIDVHAKSGSAIADYNRRKYDVTVLRDSLNAHYANDNIIFVGDFNDDVLGSIASGQESSYKSFVDDTGHFKTLTYDLTQTSASSFPSSSSFLDHIIISNELVDSYLPNSIEVEDPRGYITSYSTTTSDHLPVSARFLLVKTDQAITFAPLPAKSFGNAPFTLSASSSSNLNVSFTSSDPATVSISGNTATIHKPGSVTITARQSGNSEYNSAPNVDQTLTINKANQTITFNSLSAKTLGDSDFDLAATSTSSLAVAFASSDPTVASISGITVTIHKPGTVDITATQSGDGNYNAATDVIQSLTINKVNQTITFNSLPAKTFGDNDFDLTATSTSSLTVAFSSSDPTIASISGKTVTIHKAGNVDITATQSGDGNYNAATDVIQSLTVNKTNQTITFNSLSAKTFGDNDFDLTATSTSSLTVAFASSDPTIASVNGKTITIHKAGNVDITATQSGDGNLNAATDVTQTLIINKANQTITFNSLSAKTFGDSDFDLTATSTSSLTVAFTSSDPTIASISGKTVTIHKVGNVDITATQSGDGNYNAANNVIQSLIINKANQTITFNSLSAKTFGDNDFDLTATSTSSLTVTFASSDPTIASINGKTVTIHKPGNVDITASQSGNGNYNAATDVIQSLTVNKANQTITFNSLSPKTFGDSDFDLTATSTSSLLVAFASSDPTIASISGITVTIHKPGTVDITATQPGDGNYNAASNIIQSLVINKKNQTITFNALPPKIFGDPAFSLTATASSGLPVSWLSSDPTIASVSGNVITINKAGVVNITASQSGDATYNAANNVTQQLTISKANQTITFNALASKTFGDSDFNLTATSSSSLAVTYTSSNSAIASITGNKVSILGAGSVVITAAQSGNANYNAAPIVTQALTINKLSQTITFDVIADKTFGDAPFNLNASSTSGLTVNFTSTSDKITINGTLVTMLKPGRTSVGASQNGNVNYDAASPIERSFCINPPRPVVTLTNANTTSPLLTSSAASGNQWYLNGTAIANATGKTFTATAIGIYHVQVKADDCLSQASSNVPLVVTGDSGIDNINISIYPNPVANDLFIKGFSGEAYQIIFADNTGRRLNLPIQKNLDEFKVDLRELSQGIYMVHFMSLENVKSIKFSKK